MLVARFSKLRKRPRQMARGQSTAKGGESLMSHAGNADTVTIPKALWDEKLRIEALMDKAFKDRSAKGVSFRKTLKEIEPGLNIPDDFADAVAAPIKTEVEEIKAANKALLERLDAKDKSE